MMGVFDSGVGGLSVLAWIHRQTPTAPLCYVADQAFAPYGSRPHAWLVKRSVVICEWLVAQGARVLVVACNTATAHAITTLRKQFDVPVVGVEPGIKPASEHSLTKNIAIMATENTLASDKYRNLLMRFNPHTRIFNLPCPGLADLIEARAPRSEIRALLQQLLAPLDTLPVDHLVLGCTHYPLVKDEIQACLPTVTLVDTGEAIARVAERHWHTQPEDAALPPVRLMTTGDVGRLQGFVRHHPALRCFSDSLIQSIVLG